MNKIAIVLGAFHKKEMEQMLGLWTNFPLEQS